MTGVLLRSRHPHMARVLGTRASSRGTPAELRSLSSEGGLYPHGLVNMSPDTHMSDIIKRLGKVSIEQFQPSKFVRPQSVHYELDGHMRRWDVIDAHDSVACVIYHTERRCLLLVRQFRPALYAALLRSAAHNTAASAAAANDATGGTEASTVLEGRNGSDDTHPPVPLAAGFTCELCAGIVDKCLPLEAIAAEEIHEECGYKVNPASLERLTAFAASVGVQGSTQTLFLVRVDDRMQEGRGGGLTEDGERIELLGLPLESVEAFVMDDSVPKTSGAMFGLLWAKQHILQAEGGIQGVKGDAATAVPAR